MASIEQVVSEIAHSISQPNNVPIRRAIRLSIIHNRNKLIRQNFEKHNYIDKVLQQRFRITLIDSPDGDINLGNDLFINARPDSYKIKRSKQRVPRPVRLDNNLPFLSVRTTGVINPIEIPFVKEAGSKFYKYLPGMCKAITYDYINQYIYLNVSLNNDKFNSIGSIIVESPFELPTIINDEETIHSGIVEEHFDGNKIYNDDDEFLISEDMIYEIKKLTLDEIVPQIEKETNEIPKQNLMK